VAAVMDLLDNLEIGLCLRINGLGNRKWVRQFFSIVSRLGDGGYWAAMGGVLIMMQGVEVLPDIGRIIATTIVGIGVYKTLKGQLIRERPYITNTAIQLGAPPLDRYSFPSGHTMHAATFTVFFTHAEQTLLFATLPFAVLVAISRVLLGLHYPSDVFVGAVLGVFLASVAIVYF